MLAHMFDLVMGTKVVKDTAITTNDIPTMEPSAAALAMEWMDAAGHGWVRPSDPICGPHLLRMLGTLVVGPAVHAAPPALQYTLAAISILLHY